MLPDWGTGTTTVSSIVSMMQAEHKTRGGEKKTATFICTKVGELDSHLCFLKGQVDIPIIDIDVTFP